jgi:hypothetical protein
VLRIQAKIVMLELHVSGEDVIAFVPGKRLSPDGIQQLPFQNQKQQYDTGDRYPRTVEKRLRSV